MGEGSFGKGMKVDSLEAAHIAISKLFELQQADRKLLLGLSEQTQKLAEMVQELAERGKELERRTLFLLEKHHGF